ncbi:MAG: hypothetical protein JWL71_1722 [Acidobacteria bacterium]|nr:hypothetical protein [Acidobacteriota bacterium]
MSEALDTDDDQPQWRCPNCGSGNDEHQVVRDGPESLDMVVCRRCGATWLPRPAGRGSTAQPE